MARRSWTPPSRPAPRVGARPDGETAGPGGANTWANYSHAGGTEGQHIPEYTTVQVSCRVTGFAVANGNTWWYQVASSPWNDVFYVSADAFYNNGATSGSLAGTPYVDPAVPVCVNNQEQPLFGSSVGSSNASVGGNGCSTQGPYPVDCASGDFWHSFTDVSITGRGPGLDVSRTYNDLEAGTSGLFGPGWSSSLDQHLTFDADDGSIIVSLADGSQMTAEPNGSGGFTLPSWTDTTLQPNGDGTYTLVRRATQISTFSSSGQLLIERDLNGYQTTFTYNSSHQLTTVTDSSGRTVTVTIGSNGDITSVVDPMGRTTHYAYSPAGDLASVTDPLGRVTSFSYDGDHQMLTMTQPGGGQVTNTYDSQGRVTAQTDPAGLTTTFSYTDDNFSSIGGTTTVTDPHGDVQIKQYVNGFLTRLTKAAGTPAQAVWTYTYDPNTNQLAQITDPNAHVTSKTYDAAGDTLTSTDGLNRVTTWTYNGLREPLTVTSPKGETTTKTYDAAGNVLTVTDPAGNVTTTVYGDSAHPGDATSVTDGAGGVTTYTYDSHGYVASTTTNPSSGVHDTTQSVRDADGELVCQAPPNAVASGVSCPAAGGARVAKTSTATYDADGEKVSVTDPLGATTTYTFDALGDQLSVKDPVGNLTATTYDADRRLTSTTRGSGSSVAATTSTAYDIPVGGTNCPAMAGAVYCTAVTDGNGHVSVTAYDALDHGVAQTDANGRTTHYTYDGAGNKLTRVDAKGRTTTYTFDAANQLTATTYSDGSTPNVAYTYDLDGHRSTMADGTGTTSYTYDSDGRLSSSTNGAGALISYGYDGRGDLTSINTPNGKSSGRTFDGAGRMLSESDGVGNTTSFTYDADGNLTATSYPNGDTVARTYDQDDQVATIASNSGSSNQLTLTYIRARNGLVSRETDTGAVSSNTGYTYNARNELSTSGSTGKYAEDNASNLTGSWPTARPSTTPTSCAGPGHPRQVAPARHHPQARRPTPTTRTGTASARPRPVARSPATPTTKRIG